MMANARAAARDLMFRIRTDKARAFRRVFAGEDGGRPSYEAERVLAHLKRFCRAEGTTFHAEPGEAARREGRREVWLEIQRFIHLDDATVRRLASVEDDYVD